MPSSHLILCRPLLLLPPIPPSIRLFSNESTLRMRWPKYCSFSFSIIPCKEIPGLIFRKDCLRNSNFTYVKLNYQKYLVESFEYKSMSINSFISWILVTFSCLFFFFNKKPTQLTLFVLCVYHSSVQFSSVAQSCPTLCDPMNHSRPGHPANHQFQEFTQTHIHRVGDAIQ